MACLKIYVASFGFKEVIERVLKERNIEVDGIITPSFFYGYYDGEAMDNKNAMLREIADISGCSRILLVDDDVHNVSEALTVSNNKRRVWSYHVEGEEGIQSGLQVQEILTVIRQNDIECLVLDADMTLFEDHVTSKYVYPLLRRKKEVSDLNTSLIALADGIPELLSGINDLRCKARTP